MAMADVIRKGLGVRVRVRVGVRGRARGYAGVGLVEPREMGPGRAERLSRDSAAAGFGTRIAMADVQTSV